MIRPYLGKIPSWYALRKFRVGFPCKRNGDKDLNSARFQVGTNSEEFKLGFLCTRNGDKDLVLARSQVGMRSVEFWIGFLCIRNGDKDLISARSQVGMPSVEFWLGLLYFLCRRFRLNEAQEWLLAVRCLPG